MSKSDMLKSDKWSVLIYRGKKDNVTVIKSVKHDPETDKQITSSIKYYSVMGALTDLAKDMVRDSEYAKDAVRKGFVNSEINSWLKK